MIHLADVAVEMEDLGLVSVALLHINPITGDAVVGVTTSFYWSTRDDLVSSSESTDLADTAKFGGRDLTTSCLLR